ncbi:MAG TPA: VOC family protein, partial [Pseudomonadales bacterium]|nr:VOC family protein [Pseudomonadales bacterium]
SGALVKSDEVAPGLNGVIPYFSCDDCAVQAARAEAANGKVLRAKCTLGEYGFAALIEDPEGNRIGLHSLG